MLRSSLLRAAAATERAVDGLWFGLKWRYGLWRHLSVRPYRGFGTRGGPLHLRGRVLDDRRMSAPDPHQPAWRNALSTLHRIESDEIPGARVRLRFGGEERRAVTGADGFFTFTFEPDALPAGRLWHDVQLELEAPAPDGDSAEPAVATGHVIVPREEATFAVVSDLDDTVVHTGATNKLQMARIVLVNNASTRVPFPGVGAFYRALQSGGNPEGQRSSGSNAAGSNAAGSNAAGSNAAGSNAAGAPHRLARNPLFYVSSSPWNLYEMFEGFFEAHDIPLGPIFLKNYGLTSERFFKTGHSEHKLSRIERLLETYPELPFVLIGDSGQEDPEIYRRLVGDHEGRIRAVFIRDVTTPERDAEVHAIARQVERMGVPMFLVEDTAEAAARAADLGLIPGAAVDAVRQEMQREEREKEAPSGLRRRLLSTSGKARSVFSR